MNAMMRRSISSAAACIGLGVVLTSGCDGSTPDPSAPHPSTPVATLQEKTLSVEAAPVEPAEPPRAPLILESTEQALDEMVAAVDERRTRDYQEIEGYLTSRGNEIVPAIEKRLRSGELSTAAQIALVRQLAAAGEPALPTLEELTSPDREPIVRINAIDQISRVRPVTERATDFLRSILREGEPRDRTEALEALDRIGANSPEFVEDLRKIMDSDAPEELRKQAKKSLDRAKPRRTFEDRD